VLWLASCIACLLAGCCCWLLLGGGWARGWAGEAGRQEHQAGASSAVALRCE
jgi:hypothetical protein